MMGEISPCRKLGPKLCAALKRLEFFCGRARPVQALRELCGQLPPRLAEGSEKERRGSGLGSYGSGGAGGVSLAAHISGLG